jgi:cytidine deaminase
VPKASPRLSTNSHLAPADRNRLIDAARTMLARAYAPYSKFHVGCALLTASGAVFSGCNVENASYGLTICAERATICAAIAAEGAAMKIRALVVLNSNNAPCSPCGACRQVIFEFGPDAHILYQGRHGLKQSVARTLLPAGFSLE